MKLIYYQRNNNFGDALNPMIFQKLLPGFFDDDETTAFLGIGSIIHFKAPQAKHTVVFSSGYAYGKIPEIDESYNVICVRGPLTADKLGLDKRLAVTDGAALLKTFDWKVKKKKYACSFMPHHESINFFNWKKVCEEVGYNYIDPLEDTQKVISQILESEIIVTEAMHGAIVADTLRVPWIPVKFYPTISEFKWQDWTASLNMTYNPNILQPLYNRDTIERKVFTKLKDKAPQFVMKSAADIYKSLQDTFFNKSTIDKFSQLRYVKPFLSKEQLLDDKVEQLLKKTHDVKAEYAKTFKI